MYHRQKSRIFFYNGNKIEYESSNTRAYCHLSPNQFITTYLLVAISALPCETEKYLSQIAYKGNQMTEWRELRYGSPYG